MAEHYQRFGSCVLFKEVFSDDLGRLFRAGVIEGDHIERTIWLRVFDGAGIPAADLVAAFDTARAVADQIRSGQLVANPIFVVDEGVPALGYDHVPGQTLNRMLARSRDEAFPLQPDSALLIVERLAMALAAFDGVTIEGSPAAHGFLHPGLVQLSNDGDAQLAGVGLGPALVAALTTSGGGAGARPYLAPEILAGGQPTPAADVYSLGSILFHLLTGTALPAEPADRDAAQNAARLAWDGEPLPDDLRQLLLRTLAADPGNRLQSVAKLRPKLDQLLYGGAYSPTTFNLALFMDRLFRSEIDAEETEIAEEKEIDLSLVAPAPAVATVEPPDGDGELEAMAFVDDDEETKQKPWVWMAAAAAAVIVVAAGIFWFGRGTEPDQPAQPPTPTAEEIAARRQAQDERLRALTQEMVQQMMAEREAEIREELLARQQRIEELQRRLQQSERRAATSAQAAADEAKTQEALKREIQKQEEAQRAQQDALENERRQAMDKAAAEVAGAAGAAGATAASEGGAAETERREDAKASADVKPTSVPSPTAKPPRPTPTAPEPTKVAAQPKVQAGDFVPTDALDTDPVVIKSQPLEWPRNAARSKGKGKVVIRLTVNAQGGVDEVEVLHADHTGWGIPEAAIKAAQGYRFKPGTKDGVPVTTHAFVTWRYDFTAQ